MKNKKLLVSDLKYYCYDKIVLYISHDDDFDDIYKGDLKNIPKEMLDYEVRLIAAKRKGILDVSVKVN